MTKTYFPFDAGAGANVYESQWAEMASLWRGTGVHPTLLNKLEVFADSSGMQVKVKSGVAWMEGFFFKSDAQETLAIAASNPTNPRIDRVVVRLDRINNNVNLAVLTGTPAGAPVVPALTQTSTTWEISLARVAVAAGATTIAAGNVTDERAYSYAINPGSVKNKCFLAYVDAGTLSISAGELTISGILYVRAAAFNITFANIDTGVEGAGKNYYVYAIPGATADQFDAVISLSASAPTGYTKYRMIGWFHNNGSSNILKYSVASGEDVDYPEKGPKPGMVQYPGANWMIDIYIASDSGGTGKVIHAGNAAASAYNATPWTSLTYFAQYKSCMNAGKRLCTNEEWSMAAFGTPPGANNNTNCWTAAANTGPNPTGTLPNCVSTLGCYDMTGNVWERVATWSPVQDVYTDQAGFAWTTGSWTNEAEGGESYSPFGATTGADGLQGPRALVRGGGWNGSVDAGGWAVYGGLSPRGTSTSTGFRCCS